MLQALFVTFLWSTSWVLIKIGMVQIPPLTFAGLRYVLAVIFLLPFIARPAALSSLRNLTRRQWLSLSLLGILMIAITQGAQYLGLAMLPAVTVSLLFNFTSVLVTIMGISMLGERPQIMQWAGIALFVVGVIVYFFPILLPENQELGTLIVITGVVTNAISTILGRSINREGSISPLTVTVVSMGVGAVALITSGVITQGLPTVSPANWAILIWLAAVNTAFGFTLWNHTQRTLSAMESSIINSTMLIQIALLAWLFLGEHITWQQGAGMALAAVGTLLVQLRRRNQKSEIRKQKSEVRNHISDIVTPDP